MSSSDETDVPGVPGCDAEPTREKAAPRRSPAPEDRQRDADRSRHRLMMAALDVFAQKGFAGARVQDIADAAGVHKHLITYYFGGKAGLYLALQDKWRQTFEAHFSTPGLRLSDIAVQYLRWSLADPRPSRLTIWRALEGDANPVEYTGDDDPIERDLESIRRRQADGELSPDLDPASLRLALMGMVMAPVVMPQLVERIFGVEARTPEFEKRYAEQLRVMMGLFQGPANENEEES